MLLSNLYSCHKCHYTLIFHQPYQPFVLYRFNLILDVTQLNCKPLTLSTYQHILSGKINAFLATGSQFFSIY